jgi:hypothetical protein
VLGAAQADALGFEVAPGGPRGVSALADAERARRVRPFITWAKSPELGLAHLDTPGTSPLPPSMVMIALAQVWPPAVMVPAL